MGVNIISTVYNIHFLSLVKNINKYDSILETVYTIPLKFQQKKLGNLNNNCYFLNKCRKLKPSVQAEPKHYSLT